MSLCKESAFIKNAMVEIVYDTNNKKMRARYENGWVRFPKKLRIHGSRYCVTELRPSRSDSWLACGKITSIIESNRETI
jgi:hypothetical protein